ncbi:MAG: hypothetical protein WAM69_07005 [Candidatus Sulfotelmatobacter sp.]
MYDDPYHNLLWADTDDRLRLDAILRGKRESRMGNEHSEDAVTWNVFRFPASAEMGQFESGR